MRNQGNKQEVFLHQIVVCHKKLPSHSGPIPREKKKTSPRQIMFRNEEGKLTQLSLCVIIVLDNHSIRGSRHTVLVVLFTIECVLESGRRKSKVVSKNHTSQNSMGSYHKYLSWRIAALLQYFTSTN